MQNTTISADKQARIDAVRAAAREKFRQRMAQEAARVVESEEANSAPLSVSDFIAQHGLDGA